MGRKEDALDYHRRGRKGKLEVVPTKPLVSQIDLSLAYTPGRRRAVPRDRRERGEVAGSTRRARNLVAVISNGTAVLGLGDIGPAAGKPVMEGKACLFKKFADIDVFDLEVAETDVDKFCDIVAALEPTFGGINLEDISAPACFEIEEKLRKRMRIPVFHDDQHGTAIISGAGLLNAAELAKKPLASTQARGLGRRRRGDRVRRVLLQPRAGARRTWCCRLQGRDPPGPHGPQPPEVEVRDPRRRPPHARRRDARRRHVHGRVGREHRHAGDARRRWPTGRSSSRSRTPIRRSRYPDAIAARPDAIVATGRSDYPNQVNNVLGFPYIFRGALDCRATTISEAMKLAAARALAELTREPVPDSVIMAYGGKALKMGPDYFIPKPFDPRVAVVGRARGREGRDGVGRRADQVRHRRVPRAPDGEGQQRRVLDHAHDRPRRRSAIRGGSCSRTRRTRAFCARSSRSSTRSIAQAGAARTARGDRRSCATRCRSTCSTACEIIDPRTENEPRRTPSDSTSCASARA